MKNLSAYRDQIQELSAMIDKLENGELALDELMQMEKLTGELHAKSIILRYKAFENRVNGDKEFQLDETPEEEVRDIPVLEAPEEEEPAIDFSIFDEEDEPEPFTDVLPEPVKVAPKPEPVLELEPEPIVESEPKVEPVTAKEPEVKMDEEPISIEKPKPVQTISEQNSSKGTSFWEQIKKEDDSIGSRFAGSKIETLIGAFGLNEKLRYINDLFDGSSDAFSDAIKALDTQANMDAARAKVDSLAKEYMWDPEEESVIEFTAYIKRRYA